MIYLYFLKRKSFTISPKIKHYLYFVLYMYEMINTVIFVFKVSKDLDSI